jgi:antitoxin (DNA-binding transcriptional repressor) of toxin-antitoxin stability system
MKTMGSYDAKTHWSVLLGEVEEGETVAITRNGVLVALVVPPSQARVQDVKQAIESFKKYRRAHLRWGDGVSIKEAIEEGRK